ncbi:hypothetical protein HYG81_11865 [Natrinema zhouii]|uniref:Uncharacterized protein n=1 Tax=Natrinema zhouii TaxID=1710539 RepID=A0A7D6H1A2_9EURY|nr:hypothetical protein [Natrinema zhouii]QLK24807.1 hypothetical protein HYG81_11865 [Natrinema zhouii]
MNDQRTADRDGEGSRIATNRTAVAIAASSLLIAAMGVLLARRGLLEAIVARGVAVDMLPLYLLFVLLAVWLVIWSWGRLLTLFQ